jgi:MFS family permease
MAALALARHALTQNEALAPLRIADYRQFWTGNVVSQVGDQFQIVGLAILTLDLTHSAAMLGGVLATQAVPRTLLMLVGGLASDRFRPSQILRATNLVFAFLVGGLSALAASHVLQPWMLYMYAALAGAVYAFAFPAQQTIASEVVPLDSVRGAVTLNNTSFNASLVLGPPLAGLLVSHVGSAPAFALNACSFLFSWWCMCRVQGGQAPVARARVSSMAALREGFRAVWQSAVLRVAMIAAVFYSLGYQGANLVGVPTLAKLTLNAGDGGVGVLYGAGGVGALLAAVGIGVFGRRSRGGLLAALSLLGTGVGLAAVSRTGSIPQAAVGLFVATALYGMCAISFLTLVQTHAPAETRGRVMSLFLLGVVGFEPLSLSLGGLIGASIGARGIMLACGTMVALAGVLALASREFRTA